MNEIILVSETEFQNDAPSIEIAAQTIGIISVVCLGLIILTGTSFLLVVGWKGIVKQIRRKY